jgi:ArsR family transcriptional regulator, arsenate/arsenite/antimonite-responsive transcriptional repressor
MEAIAAPEMQRQLRKTTRIDALETLFKALADRTRLRILALLGAGEVCVCDIHESLRIPQPKASRHLAYLKRAGLVQDRKQGLWVHYHLADPADPVVATVLGAVTHALGHVASTETDLRRLECEVGAPAPRRSGWPVAVCCGRPVGDGVQAAQPAKPSCC